MLKPMVKTKLIFCNLILLAAGTLTASASEADIVEPQGLPFREDLIGLCGEA